MRYFGIKVPNTPYQRSYIWWIAEDEPRCWQAFFQFPNKDGNYNSSRAPTSEAIAAYTAIGYKCVELDITEKVCVAEGHEICSGCKNEIDPTTCHCGTEMDKHTQFDNHSAVPMGCTCGYANHS